MTLLHISISWRPFIKNADSLSTFKALTILSCFQRQINFVEFTVSVIWHSISFLQYLPSLIIILEYTKRESIRTHTKQRNIVNLICGFEKKHLGDVQWCLFLLCAEGENEHLWQIFYLNHKIRFSSLFWRCKMLYG